MVKIIDANEDDYAAKFDLLTFEGFDAIDSGHAPNQFGRNGHDLIAFGQSSPRTPKKIIIKSLMRSLEPWSSSGGGWVNKTIE